MTRANWMEHVWVALLALALPVPAAVAVQGGADKGKSVKLPAAVAKAVKENRPNAEIDTVVVEDEAGVKLYDVEFKRHAGEIEVAEDGTVIDIATIIEMKDVPRAAAAVIQKIAAGAGAKIKQLEKSEVRAEVRTEGAKGSVVKLASPKYVYEAELEKGNQTGEVQVAPDGSVVEALKWNDVTPAAKPETEKSKKYK